MKPYAQKIPDTDQAISMTPIPVGAKRQGRTYPATVLMGSADSEAGRSKKDGPRTRVKIQPFWMGTYEITCDQYHYFATNIISLDNHRLDPRTTAKSVWLDAVSLPTIVRKEHTDAIYKGMGQFGGYPVAAVSPLAARQFTKWLSQKTGHFYRLPTEAEWEYAARAGTKTAYPWGDKAAGIDDHAWYYDNSAYDDPDKGHPDTGSGYRKVGSKKPNAWGLYDIHGNVSEWVIDQYFPDHNRKFAGRTIDWKQAIAWPKNEYGRIAKGGSWDSDARDCRSASRLLSDRYLQESDPQGPKSPWWYSDGFHIGFRIVRPLHEPSDKQKLRYWEPASTQIRQVLQTQRKQVRALLANDKNGKP